MELGVAALRGRQFLLEALRSGLEDTNLAAQGRPFLIGELALRLEPVDELGHAGELRPELGAAAACALSHRA